MTEQPNAWRAADKAYQDHHAVCGHCRSAGINPGRYPRCAAGAALWATYLEAGDPPHFLWLCQSTTGEAS